ncbi:ABC transporter ATP-binding protein [Paeniglutamicibacter sp. MACA_103]|uniref:ABC transporter ATP-binding protein n=1 Tax=Paeniglutamicibacter sp. MACA_103 TaxID=3377337 RepID=UPI003895DACE
MASQLEIKDLSVRAGTNLLLDGISCSVRSGELVAVVGRSGSGKTMLTKAIMGLLPSGLQATGQILLDGQRLDTLGERHKDAVRGRKIGMLFQQPKRVMNPRMTVRAHLLEAMGATGFRKPGNAEKNIESLLQEVGLSPAAEIARMRPDQLSGGMAQRVMLAIALAADPAYILADEPTSSLDSILKAEILELLRRRQLERGLGILLITHDIASVQHIADRVIVVSDGAIVDQCPTSAMFSAPRHEKTRELLSATASVTREPQEIATHCVLRADAVGKNYTRRAKGAAALNPTSMSLHAGEVLGVVGRSGSGKSTFARLLAGLERPTHGEITGQTEGAQSTGVQIIPQEPFGSFDPALDLRTSLMAAVHRLPDSEAAQLIERAVARVGLPVRLLDRLPAQCSGGQLQRMAIARALLVQPDVLICDESTSALDSVAQRHILDLLLQLRERMGISLVVISHDMDVIRYVSDRVAVFYAGNLVELEPLAQFLAAPEHPHSQQLVRSVDKENGYSGLALDKTPAG